MFERERAAMDALTEGKIGKGDVVVIRYEGPKGGPGMREMLAITAAIKGAGLGKDVLLLTDGDSQAAQPACVSATLHLRHRTEARSRSCATVT